jgi:hypothetical protein
MEIMRYLNIKTYRQSTIGGDDCYPDTDPRVEVWFQKVDLVKYDRAFDSEGFPILLEYSLQEDGTRYSHYLQVPNADGIYMADWGKIEADIDLATARYAVEYIESIVQAKIDKYNADHNLAFTGIEGMAKYIRRPTYSHYQFALDVLDWNEDLWEKTDDIKRDVLSNVIPQPTPEEFDAMLPEYTGVI